MESKKTCHILPLGLERKRVRKSPLRTWSTCHTTSMVPEPSERDLKEVSAGSNPRWTDGSKQEFSLEPDQPIDDGAPLILIYLNFKNFKIWEKVCLRIDEIWHLWFILKYLDTNFLILFKHYTQLNILKVSHGAFSSNYFTILSMTLQFRFRLDDEHLRNIYTITRIRKLRKHNVLSK